MKPSGWMMKPLPDPPAPVSTTVEAFVSRGMRSSCAPASAIAPGV
jgi:hypothetical protein